MAKRKRTRKPRRRFLLGQKPGLKGWDMVWGRLNFLHPRDPSYEVRDRCEMMSEKEARAAFRKSDLTTIYELVPVKLEG